MGRARLAHYCLGSPRSLDIYAYMQSEAVNGSYRANSLGMTFEELSCGTRKRTDS